MSKIKEFVAFRAMQALLKEHFLENKMEEAYHKVLANMNFGLLIHFVKMNLNSVKSI